MTLVVPRRTMLQIGTAAALAAPAVLRSRPAAAGNPGGVRVGAIRWDSWYGPYVINSSEWYAVHTLDPAPWQSRAPWFATQTSANSMSVSGGQANMDAEITYASTAGLKYWAFDWYASNRPLRNAWNYYQASPNKALINWCVLTSYGSFATSLPPISELVTYFQQATYEKYGARPLLYLLQDSTALASVTAQVTALRAACVTAGISDPYIIVQSGTPSSAASDKTTIGADAIGNYAHARTGPSTYAAFDTDVRAFWATMAATGAKMIPTGMTGWDGRPIKAQPIPFYNPNARPYLNMNDYVTAGSASEIATHITALVAYVTANPTPCESNKALIYSWTESIEGGSTLIPTWTSGGPDSSLLTALSSVLQ